MPFISYSLSTARGATNLASTCHAARPHADCLGFKCDAAVGCPSDCSALSFQCCAAGTAYPATCQQAENCTACEDARCDDPASPGCPGSCSSTQGYVCCAAPSADAGKCKLLCAPPPCIATGKACDAANPCCESDGTECCGADAVQAGTCQPKGSCLPCLSAACDGTNLTSCPGSCTNQADPSSGFVCCPSGTVKGATCVISRPGHRRHLSAPAPNLCGGLCDGAVCENNKCPGTCGDQDYVCCTAPSPDFGKCRLKDTCKPCLARFATCDPTSSAIPSSGCCSSSFGAGICCPLGTWTPNQCQPSCTPCTGGPCNPSAGQCYGCQGVVCCVKPGDSSYTCQLPSNCKSSRRRELRSIP